MNTEVNINVGEVDVDSQVTMNDGRVVEFSKRSRANKAIVDNGDGTFTVEMDFKNGESRKYSIDHCAIRLYAEHGALQKFGDTFNAFGNVEGEALSDAINALDTMAGRINTGVWEKEGKPSEAKGGSMLVAALIEHLNITREKAQQFISTIDGKQKAALLVSPELAPIVQRIRQEKFAKDKNPVDTNSLLDALKNT